MVFTPGPSVLFRLATIALVASTVSTTLAAPVVDRRAGLGPRRHDDHDVIEIVDDYDHHHHDHEHGNVHIHEHNHRRYAYPPPVKQAIEQEMSVKEYSKRNGKMVRITKKAAEKHESKSKASDDAEEDFDDDTGADSDYQSHPHRYRDGGDGHGKAEKHLKSASSRPASVASKAKPAGVGPKMPSSTKSEIAADDAAREKEAAAVNMHRKLDARLFRDQRAGFKGDKDVHIHGQDTVTGHHVKRSSVGSEAQARASGERKGLQFVARKVAEQIDRTHRIDGHGNQNAKALINKRDRGHKTVVVVDDKHHGDVKIIDKHHRGHRGSTKIITGRDEHIHSHSHSHDDDDIIIEDAHHSEHWYEHHAEKDDHHHHGKVIVTRDGQGDGDVHAEGTVLDLGGLLRWDHAGHQDGHAGVEGHDHHLLGHGDGHIVIKKRDDHVHKHVHLDVDDHDHYDHHDHHDHHDHDGHVIVIDDDHHRHHDGTTVIETRHDHHEAELVDAEVEVGRHNHTGDLPIKTHHKRHSGSTVIVETDKHGHHRHHGHGDTTVITHKRAVVGGDLVDGGYRYECPDGHGYKCHDLASVDLDEDQKKVNSNGGLEVAKRLNIGGDLLDAGSRYKCADGTYRCHDLLTVDLNGHHQDQVNSHGGVHIKRSPDEHIHEHKHVDVDEHHHHHDGHHGDHVEIIHQGDRHHHDGVTVIDKRDLKSGSRIFRDVLREIGY